MNQHLLYISYTPRPVPPPHRGPHRGPIATPLNGGGGIGTPVGFPWGGVGRGQREGERRQEKPSSAISTLGTVWDADLMPFRSFAGHSVRESKPRNALHTQWPTLSQRQPTNQPTTKQ